MNEGRTTEFALKSSEAYETVQLDKNKLDQGKYQAGVIQDFMPALGMTIAFGKSTKYWDNMVPDYLQAFDEFQLGGMYNTIGKTPFMYIHGMAFCLLCLLEEHRREMLAPEIYAPVQYPFLLGAFKLALKEVAELGSMNNKPFGKYDRGSWMQVKKAKERYLDAFWRHQLEDLYVVDETTGKIHMVAMLWNLLALIHFDLCGENSQGNSACDECDGTGWVHNAVEGKSACVCMTEAEPFQIALVALDKLAKLGNGDQYRNSEGNEIAAEALRTLIPFGPICINPSLLGK